MSVKKLFGFWMQALPLKFTTGERLPQRYGSMIHNVLCGKPLSQARKQLDLYRHLATVHQNRRIFIY